MKKLFTLLALTCSLVITTQAQIQNPGFENWTAGDPDGWVTSNVFPAGIVTITQTGDLHSGTSALKGEVVDFMGTPVSAIIQSGPGGTGFAVTERYLSLGLYYKFSPLGGDKFSVNLAMEKGGNVIAQGAAALPASVDVYTFLSVPLTYTTGDTPDNAIIQISITGPVTGSDYHTGSVMYLDELVFSFASGTEITGIPEQAGKCYPNPASDYINVPVNSNTEGEVLLQVFDVYGKKVKQITGYPQMNGKNSFRFPVEDLSTGMYFYSLTVDNRYYHGKFTVSR